MDYRSKDPLPPPEGEAAAHGAKVAAALRGRIAASGGFLPFAEFMRFALYEPGLGYYVAGASKLGAGGDFVTAPEMTPLFAGALAAQVAAIAGSGGAILELGAGSGKLAAGLLVALEARAALPSRYAILEVSPELAQRQRATIAQAVPHLAARVAWLETLPGRFAGAVVMNEVLDAIPCALVARTGGRWYERGVRFEGERLAWAEHPLEGGALRTLAEQRFPPAVDYASELNPAAEALIASLGGRLEHGALVILDYGFPRHEYYHPQRAQGTLMAHYRHRALTDVLAWPGLCDVTAHVDFTAMAAAGVGAGLDLAGFTSQAAFLLGCGILDELAAVGPPGGVAYAREAAAVQRLTSPAEMGELFKVLALARGIDCAWPGFAVADMRHRL